MHLHTTRSDGSLEPGEVVRRAAELGFRCVAITDHDTCAGLEEAAAAAKRLGVELIPGIEISTIEDGGSIHILGYMVDASSQAIRSVVEKAGRARRARMEKIVDKLNGLGYGLDIGGLTEFTGEGVLGRAVLARYLVELGHFPTERDVFQAVLGDGKAAFVPISAFTPEEAIELVSRSGGVASLAHPGNPADVKRLGSYIDAGLAAVEAFSPSHGAGEQREWVTIARQRGLLVTGGSDSHGDFLGGPGLGSVKLPYRFVEQLKEKAAPDVAATPL